MKHNHVTRDIKAPGKCPGCDEYWQKAERVVESTVTPDISVRFKELDLK